MIKLYKHKLKLLLGNHRLIALAFFIAVFIGSLDMGARMMNMDGDLGRHLVVGGYIVDHHMIPTRDVFSSTMLGQPLSPHEWLAEVLFTLAYRLLGFSGVILLTASILAFSWYLLSSEVLKRNNKPWITIPLIILGIAASSIHWLTRPHIFTFLLLIIFIIIYESDRPFWFKTGTLALLMLIWVNCHGAFITAYLYLLINLGTRIITAIFKKQYFLKNLKDGLFLPILFCVSLINPVGIHIYQTIFTFLNSRFLVAHTAEYIAPNLLSAPYFAFLIFLVTGIVSCLLGRKKARFSEIAQFIGWSIMGITSARNIPLAIIIGIPILSAWSGDGVHKSSGIQELNEFPKKITKKEDITIIGIQAFFIIVLIGYYTIFPGAGKQYRFSEALFPVKAVDYLTAHPLHGNSYNYFQWGGYLLFRLWPDHNVFIDGQTDFYGEALTREYADVITAKNNYQSILDKYGVKWLIIPKNETLAKQLNTSSEYWGIYYQDDLTVIYIRKVLN